MLEASAHFFVSVPYTRLREGAEDGGETNFSKLNDGKYCFGSFFPS
jgi:hypothetical protein